MIPALRPVAEPAEACPGGLPLAGSALVRFARLRRHPDLAEVAADDLSPETRAAYAAPRPPLCGLSLDRPRIMGILNVTPDSFSDGGQLPDPAAVVARARAMAADILDIGGESTRPGAEPVPVADEVARVVPAIRALRDAGIATPISVDTRKAEVAAAALDAGADMVNDVSAGLYDPAMLPLVAARGVPVCLMHARGDPRTMQDDPRYGDVVTEVAAHLSDRADAALAAGVRPEAILLDPGIGFGKTVQHNLMLLRAAALYHGLGMPLLVGASRKRFIGALGGAEAAGDRMPGSVAVALHAAARGVQVLRVHDVAETRQALALWAALDGAGAAP